MIEMLNVGMLSIKVIMKLKNNKLLSIKLTFIISAEPGMGKTATVAMISMKYVAGEEGMQTFDFVWTIKLKNVDKTSSLTDIVIQQHDKLKGFEAGQIKSILEGRTESKVALLFDGYDEYQTGRNKEIDKVLESGIGNCFVVLTSRPGYVGDEIRKKMDYEVTIEGLNVINIEKCSQLYLETWGKSADMLKQARAVGIYQPNDWFIRRLLFPSTMIDEAILRIPIMLLMTCFIYEENQSLPETRTGILKKLYQLLGDRSVVRSRSTSANTDTHDKMLFRLGKLSWEALKRDVLILRKVKLQNSCRSAYDFFCNFHFNCTADILEIEVNSYCLG